MKIRSRVTGTIIVLRINWPQIFTKADRKIIQSRNQKLNSLMIKFSRSLVIVIQEPSLSMYFYFVINSKSRDFVSWNCWESQNFASVFYFPNIISEFYLVKINILGIKLYILVTFFSWWLCARQRGRATTSPVKLGPVRITFRNSTQQLDL